MTSQYPLVLLCGFVSSILDSFFCLFWLPVAPVAQNKSKLTSRRVLNLHRDKKSEEITWGDEKVFFSGSDSDHAGIKLAGWKRCNINRWDWQPRMLWPIGRK